MEVTGRITKRKGHTLGACVGDEATIELNPVDVSKIKEGDKVWVEMTVPNIHTNTFMSKYQNKFVSHFPQPQPKQEKDNPEVKIPEEIEDLSGYPQNIITYKINEIIEYLEKKE